MQLLNIEESAARLSMHPETVRKMIRAGQLPAVKIGRTWKVETGKLESFVDALSQSTARQHTTKRADSIWRERGGELPQPETTDRKGAAQKGFGFLKGKIASSDSFLEQRHDEARAEQSQGELV